MKYLKAIWILWINMGPRRGLINTSFWSLLCGIRTFEEYDARSSRWTDLYLDKFEAMTLTRY